MRLKNNILTSILVFVILYPITLFLWIQVKGCYSQVIVTIGAYLSAWSMGVEVDRIVHGQEDSLVTFVRSVYYTGRGFVDLLLDITLSVSGYSFNVPLTLSLTGALFSLYKWRKRVFLEIVAMLASIHLLAIYSYCSLQIFKQLLNPEPKFLSKATLLLLEFTWTFVDAFIIRFEPFLIGVYLWLTGKKKSSKAQN